MSKKDTSFRSIIIIICLTMVAKLIGLVRETFIGQSLGAGFDTDTYVQAYSLTVFVFLGIGSAMATNIIPIVVRYRKENSNAKSVSAIFSWLMVFTTAAMLIYLVAAEPIVMWFSNGFAIDKLSQTAMLVRIMLPTMMTIILQYFMVGVLQANEKFVLPAIASFPANLLFFVYLIFGIDTYGVVGLGVMVTVFWLTQLVVLVPSVIKNKLVPFKWNFSLKDKETRHFFIGVLPIVVVTLTHHFNIIIDNMMASWFEDGSVSSIYFGNLLFTAVVTTTVYGITAVMFPKFNQKFLEDNKDGLFQSVINVLRSIMLLLIPMSVGMIMIGPHIITLVFERGLFDTSDTMTTVVAFTGYTSFMLAFGFVDVLNKAYYTLGNRRIPLMVSGLIIGVNFALNYVLVETVGFMGIPIGTSLAFYIGAAVSFYLFYRQNKGFVLGRFFNTLIKTIISAVLMGVSVYVVNSWLITMIPLEGIGRLLVMIVDIVVGIIVYAVTLIVVREQLVTHAISQLKSRLVRR